MASRVAAIMTVSCRLAPLRQKPSGVPRASVTRWRFVPGLPRSVGFGPVAGPLFSRDRRAVQASPVPVDLTRCVQALQQHVMQAAPYARRLPIPQPPASNSCRSRSPSRPAASPTADPSAARTGCPSVRPDSRSDDARPWDGTEAAGGAERSHPRDHRGEAVWPCKTNARHPTRCRSVRRSKCARMEFKTYHPHASAQAQAQSPTLDPQTRLASGGSFNRCTNRLSTSRWIHAWLN